MCERAEERKKEYKEVKWNEWNPPKWHWLQHSPSQLMMNIAWFEPMLMVDLYRFVIRYLMIMSHRTFELIVVRLSFFVLLRKMELFIKSKRKRKRRREKRMWKKDRRNKSLGLFFTLHLDSCLYIRVNIVKVHNTSKKRERKEKKRNWKLRKNNQ